MPVRGSGWRGIIAFVLRSFAARLGSARQTIPEFSTQSCSRKARPHSNPVHLPCQDRHKAGWHLPAICQSVSRPFRASAPCHRLDKPRPNAHGYQPKGDKFHHRGNVATSYSSSCSDHIRSYRSVRHSSTCTVFAGRCIPCRSPAPSRLQAHCRSR